MVLLCRLDYAPLQVRHSQSIFVQLVLCHLSNHPTSSTCQLPSKQCCYLLSDIHPKSFSRNSILHFGNFRVSLHSETHSVEIPTHMINSMIQCLLQSADLGTRNFESRFQVIINNCSDNLNKVPSRLSCSPGKTAC